ncbi:Phosphatidylinositol glycan anchor biosynthesis class U protein [Morus notabilis]|uniref:Phosphatidylinositol glycan anchor biosynthesis class U protein n=1 Tax=Morus notabilis TaxID=981085 RepID=W9SB35_9ROSA|nr:Phosphatidylinositol glycan anchor biosynthesis class U protein [Morus notabilis]
MAAKEGRFWGWAFASVIFRLILIYFPNNLNLSSRPEVSTPLTSLRRLAEGYWLKQSSLSPYAGSMYHGSPLLLYVLGPLTAKSLVFVIADVVNALLIRVIGQNLQISYNQRLKALSLDAIPKEKAILPSRDIAALVYLWNPFTIVSCVGLSTSPIENMAVILSLYGACTRYGPETPPRKLFDGKVEDSASSNHSHRAMKQQGAATIFSWKPVLKFLMWSVVWSIYVLVLCGLCVRHYGGLHEMFKRTYGFILTVPDLSPNIGVLWYFFAEVFEFFRNFFLIVFHMNILFMVLPLAIRLNHRPCFLAFVYIAISSMLKSYPSVGDAALYLGLLGLFVNELAGKFIDMQFSFFLFCVYVGVSLLSPVMHNLWIWRGTGNANFYFATAMAYACFQIVLVVESVSAMLSHDRKLKKLSIAKHQESKSQQHSTNDLSDSRTRTTVKSAVASWIEDLCILRNNAFLLSI